MHCLQVRQPYTPVSPETVQRQEKQVKPVQTMVWGSLAAAFWAQLLGTQVAVSVTRLPSGRVVRQDATLQFM